MTLTKPFQLFFLLVLSLLLMSCFDNKPEYHILANGTPESCVTCHSEIQGFSRFHNPKTIGCSACHLGNIDSYDKDVSHSNMIKIPGNLSNASKTCATANCHYSELDRVNKSLMATNSGIVSIDRWAFGETSTTDTLFHIKNIAKSAADTHIKNLCFTCHLGYEKKHYSPTDELSRGGGCLACHLNYSHDTKPDVTDNIHPTLSLNIGNDKCFGCHSRSSRISTNYEGWFETLLSENEIKDSTGYRLLQDGRVFDYVGDDVHHKAGLLCIDCHTSQEVMGDGKSYKHQSTAVKIQCSDCHTNGQYNKIGFDKIGGISAIDYGLRGYKHPSDTFICTEEDSIALINTFFDEKNQAFLVSKISQEVYQLSNSCEKDKVHGNLDCTMCHTAWVPSCIGCHTAYDENILLTNGKKGKWYEMMGEFNFSKPIMGVKHIDEQELIIPAMPGMIMTLDKSNHHSSQQVNDSIFLRLFAPIAAHTTTKEVRSCESCHNSSEALGYGKGELEYIVTKNSGKWSFESLYTNIPNDNLPQDAWIGFLSQHNDNRTYSANENFFPLSLKKQKKVLQVGTCFSCHKEEEFKERMLYENFQKLLHKRTKDCTVVKW